ncbi:DNA alkylation repair protein, partial [Rhodoluna sp.]|uniref:DNA alkylation repair protein n=1 Tax=Rhodoluna sp. TaxID=1969481 RepID=UPI0025E2DFF8
RTELFDFYLQNVYAQRVNNWDLVDSTAPYFGELLIGRTGTDKLLNSLAASDSLWERRTAVLFTAAFIRDYRFDEILRLAKKLLKDDQDLMHKAVGWMLREVGNRESDVLRAFLHEHANRMPRTMLRYSIEKLSETERKRWLTFKG